MIEPKKYKKNILIMILPILLPSIVFLMILGESFILFAIPLVICLCMTVSLSKKISTKDAIVYPFVQYPFLVLLFALLSIASPGLEFILILPVTFIINMSIGFIYFRSFKNKKWYTNILVLLLTLIITFVIYPPVFALSPAIEHGEFPFRIVYEINGVVYEIEDVIVCEFRGVHEGRRIWSMNLKSGNSIRISIFEDNDVPSAFTTGRINEEIDIWFCLGSAAYFMGDRRESRSGPGINYTELYRMPGGGGHRVTSSITKDQLLEHFGIEIITWSFSEPIRNTFR